VLAGLAFTTYFLAHDSRDQVFFYFVNGDAPRSADPKKTTSTLVWAPFLLVGAVGALLALGAGLGLVRQDRSDEMLAGIPGGWRLAATVLPLLIVIAAAFVWRGRLRREGYASWRDLWRAHRPVLAVFAGTALIFAVGILLGLKTYTIVVLHALGWYVFGLHQARVARAAADVAPPVSRWQKLRASPGGFQFLHVGSFAAAIALGVLWAYGFGNDPALRPLWVVLDRENFFYWTILHVSVSWGR
jgi:hypothetical protein